VDRLDRVSRKYSLFINVDKIACSFRMSNCSRWIGPTFRYLGSLVTDDGECTIEFRTRLNGAGDRGIAAENMAKSQHTDFNEDMTNESVSVAHVATYGCESWTLRKNEETRFAAFKMKRAGKDTAGFVDSQVNE